MDRIISRTYDVDLVVRCDCRYILGRMTRRTAWDGLPKSQRHAKLSVVLYVRCKMGMTETILHQQPGGWPPPGNAVRRAGHETDIAYASMSGRPTDIDAGIRWP